MTNKPMLSVKKFIHEVTYEGGEMVEVDKLPELCGSELYVLDSDYQSLHEQLELLRAFLDKPSTHHQGEPVAWQFYQDGKWWNGDDRIKDHRKNTENSGYKTRELYAEQPEPAADHTQCEECKGWGYHENHHEGGGTECGECGGSGNATVAVAVVMPEKKSVPEPEDYNTNIDEVAFAEGYNDALDDVARLNEVKP